MQVNSGKNKGTHLFSSPELDVRPTTDKVKQAIFNIISFMTSDGSVLDLFAGSGAMGIEALSRGFKECDFCDVNPVWVEKNVKKCRLESESRIIKSDFEAFLQKAGIENKKYSLVFLDPPYHKGYAEKALFSLCEKKLLAENAVIVIETDYDESFRLPDGIQIAKEKLYGRIKICIGVYKL